MASINNQERSELRELLYNTKGVYRSLSDRSVAFKNKSNEYEQLKSAKSVEPRFQLSGDLQKPLNLEKQKNQILNDINELRERSNKEIETQISDQLREQDLDDYQKQLEKYDTQELLDEQITIQNAHHPDGIYTNKEISEFLEKEGFEVSKDQEFEKSKDQEIAENKQDIWADFDKWWDGKKQQAKEEIDKDRSREFKVNEEDVGISPEDDL